ncbi:hypothetical protein [Chitinophaga sp. S165]|uniref:hypothetical protein n=1 Tax=Chitinophaga sp. S165 TaxID=2135462 RepID=UPI000D7142FF|nr:hypothetical protein [Chitinophaga sp. S165]PWV46153.1 hypothetical protein C7475_11156 [Chitinophaga sp. S165]
MPKIAGGVPPFVGTRDNLTIYLMNGEYIIRTKSSLTGKRIKHDPAFAKTMMYAGWLKVGARIASHIYRQIPADERVYKQYRELTGKAMSLLKEGFNADDVVIMMEAVYLSQSMDNITGRETNGYNVCCEYHECCSEHTGVVYKENDGDYYNEHSLKYTGKSNDVYVKCNRERLRLYVCSYSCNCSSSCSTSDNFNVNGHHECLRIRAICDSKYNSKYNSNYVKSMHTDRYMNIYCHAIIGETARSERCRWESLALVI